MDTIDEALPETATGPCSITRRCQGQSEGGAGHIQDMSVIVEFTISTDNFLFGSALETDEDLDIELEAIVPTGKRVVPYFWATGGDFPSFEAAVLADPDIAALAQLDRVEDSALYRAEWSTDIDGLLNGLAETEAVVLEATTQAGGWYFRVRFPDHDLLGRFYNFTTEHELAITIGRVYTLAEASRAGRNFDLTPEQRDALILAVKNGYFKVPRGTDLSAISEELDISQQAASKLVRRGAQKVLAAALLAPGERV